MKLLVGCPVRAREWCLRPWFLFVEQACEAAAVEPDYVVALAEDDQASLSVIGKCCADAGRELHVVHTGETVEPYVRLWMDQRYYEMVDVRNQLLAQVRKIDPDYFLSLDSDILLNENALKAMLEQIRPDGQFDAVGAKTYLTDTGTQFPNYAHLVNANGMIRPDSFDLLTVDAIMAIKLMSKPAYWVDYSYHFQGEDIGWSLTATGHRLKLGWDGRYPSKHVMLPQQLEQVDGRCGY